MSLRTFILAVVLGIEVMGITFYLVLTNPDRPVTMGAITLSNTVQPEQPNVPATVAPATEPVTNTPTEPQTDAVTEENDLAEDVPPAPTVAPTPTPEPTPMVFTTGDRRVSGTLYGE